MAMNKQITLEQAVEKVHDGMTIMFGGGKRSANHRQNR